MKLSDAMHGKYDTDKCTSYARVINVGYAYTTYTEMLEAIGPRYPYVYRWSPSAYECKNTIYKVLGIREHEKQKGVMIAGLWDGHRKFCIGLDGIKFLDLEETYEIE